MTFPALTQKKQVEFKEFNKKVISDTLFGTVVIHPLFSEENKHVILSRVHSDQKHVDIVDLLLVLELRR